MKDLVNVVLHDIGLTGQWPEKVAEISRFLSYPLPRVLLSDDIQHRLSPGASEIFNQALQSPSLVIDDQENILGPHILVSDVIDTILSCARMVKAAHSFDQADGQAKISWISVLTILGIAMSENIFIMEDIKYLRARTTKRSKVTDIEELEGQAAILFSTLLPAPSVSDSSTERDISESETYYNSSSPSEDRESFCEIDLPLDAHILPGRGKRANCFVPIVCAAAEHEIEDLLTSILCQRHTLNISLPIMGVSLSTSGTTAKIVIGWIDGNSDKDEGVIVHLAYMHENGIPCASMGLFDMMDPVSMLFFGQFILRLQTQSCHIKENAEGMKARNFCWRLDHLGCDHSGEDLSGQVSRTVSWVRDQSHQKNHECRSDDCAFPATMAPKPDSGKNVGKGSIKGKINASSAIDPDDQLLQPPAAASQATASSNASRHSVSKFAKLTGSLGDEGVETWLWERNTLRLHRIKLSEYGASELALQVNDMVVQYEQVTRISLPSSWTTLAEILKSDKVYDSLRKELMEDCTEYRSKKPTTDVMEADVYSSIQNHISSLFKAIAAARVYEKLGEVAEGPESLMRSVWDDLMKTMCCDKDEALSRNFFVEKTIPLPKNKAVEAGETFPHIRQSHTWNKLTASQVFMAVKLPVAVQLALNASRSLVLNLVAVPYDIVTAAERSFEPGQARSDGICCLRYKLQDPPMLDQKTAKASEKWWMTPFLKRLSYKRRSECTVKDPPKTGKTTAKKTTKTTDKKADLQGEPQSQEPDTDPHSECVMCPDVTEAGPSSSRSKPALSMETEYEVDIPLIFADYKGSVSMEQAFHQGQIYLTFGVEFLAALGVTDFPVWCLVTSGIKGTILMAWKSTKSTELPSTEASGTADTSNPSVNYNIIIDRYTKTFDLTEPMQALQLMASLHRLFQSTRKLETAVKAQLLSNPTLFSQPSDLMLQWMPKAYHKSKQATESNA